MFLSDYVRMWDDVGNGRVGGRTSRQKDVSGMAMDGSGFILGKLLRLRKPFFCVFLVHSSHNYEWVSNVIRVVSKEPVEQRGGQRAT